MNTHITGFKKTLWLLHERLRVARMLIRIAIVNQRHTGSVVEKFNFGSHPNQYIVLHYKREFIGQNKPVVFFIHGGGWAWGNPDLHRFVGNFLAERGYPAILGGYRHTPQYQFPCQLDDAYLGLKAGLRLALAHGLETNAIILAGQSAGAQLASLMLFDRERYQEQGLSSGSFIGLLLISGVLSFIHFRNKKGVEMLQKYLGPRENWDQADPIRFIRGDEAVPVLCIHGERDLLVDSANSISFIRKLNGNGEIYLAPNTYHTDMTTMFLDHMPATEVMLRWLEKVSSRATKLDLDSDVI